MRTSSCEAGNPAEQRGQRAVELLHHLSPAFPDAQAQLGQRPAGGGQQVAPGIPQQQVAGLQGAAIAAQQAHEQGIEKAEHLVEEAAAHLRGAGDGFQILVGEQDAGNVLDELEAVPDALAVHPNLLAALPVQAHRHLAAHSSLGSEAPSHQGFLTIVQDHALVGGGAEGTPVGQQVHRLQEVGLALAVFTDQEHFRGFQRHLASRQIAEVVAADGLEAHQPICMGMTMWK